MRPWNNTPGQFHADAVEIASAFAAGGLPLARLVCDAIVQARRLKAWEAMLLRERALAEIHGGAQ